MRYEFSPPTNAVKVPAGPDWLHEVKYDGWRMMLIREQDRVRLISNDWAPRFPPIAEEALKLRQDHLSSTARPSGSVRAESPTSPRCISTGEQAQLYAFRHARWRRRDHRRLMLSLRKANLDRLLSQPVDGIFMAPYEQGEIGPDLFRAACRMGLEGIVSKQRGRAYVGGKCKHWVKVKNREHPAYTGVRAARA